jgi:hypothetical protein
MAKKKSFLETSGAKETSNPALSFISEESIKAVEEKESEEKKGQAFPLKAPKEERPPKGYKINPMFIETKSKRMQLVVQPSLYESLKKASKRAGLSVNEYCHRVLSEATKEERKK